MCFVSKEATRLVFWGGELGKGMYDTKIAVGRVGKIRIFWMIYIGNDYVKKVPI